MSRQNTISAIIIAKNEEKRIERCIRSVSFTDEVLVVDNGSMDDTVAIAKKLHANVYTDRSRDFASLRNFGKEKAKGVWLLYIDADEVVTEKLAKEIQEKIKDGFSAYFITRRNYYLGYEWPTRDEMVRFIKKDALISWKGKLHEHPEIQGEIGRLREPLVHTTHRTLEEMVEKTNIWSEVEADLRFCSNHPRVSWWRFFRVMGSAFWNSFIREGGWRAGAVGWIESIYQAFSMFITYAKLWEKQNTEEKY